MPAGNTICGVHSPQRLFTFAVSLVLLMACLLVTFSAIYAQLRPLLKLKEQMELVMSVNLNAEVATTNSRDEISSLSRTFNNMVNEISHLINEIQVTPGRFDVFYHIDDSLLDCRTLKLYPLRSSLFHVNWQFIYFILSGTYR